MTILSAHAMRAHLAQFSEANQKLYHCSQVLKGTHTVYHSLYLSKYADFYSVSKPHVCQNYK